MCGLELKMIAHTDEELCRGNGYFDDKDDPYCEQCYNSGLRVSEGKPFVLCPSCDNLMLEGQKLCSSCKDIHRHALTMMREANK